MKNFIKALVIALSVLMITVSLCSCSSVKPDDSRVVVKLDGEEIYYDYFKYVYLNAKRDADGGEDSYWNGNLLAQIELSDTVMQTLIRNKAILNIAEEYGIKLTSEEKDAVREEIEAAREELGEEGFKEKLSQTYFTEYSLSYVREFTALWQKVHDYLVSEQSGIIDSADDTVLKDIPENFYCVKYVYIAYDSENDTLQRAEEVYEKAVGGEDFDELIKKYGKDSNMQSVLKNGYYFTKGQAIAQIEKVASETEIGEISEIVDIGNAYVIVKRLPLDMDYIKTDFEYFRSCYCARIANEIIDKRALEVEVEYTDLFAELNVSNVK